MVNSAFLGVRRRHIAAKGRPMELRRPTSTSAYTAVSVRGILYGYTPDEIAGDIRQGDAMVYILNDEVSATGWPGPPRRRDSMLIDGRAWSVEGATAVYDGTTLLGHNLWVRGG